MSTAEMSDGALEREAELQRLQARVRELEEQLLASERWGNETVAAAQENLYWFERWGVDFNSIMRRPAAERARSTVRAIRAVYRFALKLKRRLTQSL